MSDPRLEAVKAAALAARQSDPHGDDVDAAVFLAMLDAALSCDDEDEATESVEYVAAAPMEPEPQPQPQKISPEPAAAEEPKTPDTSPPRRAKR